MVLGMKKQQLFSEVNLQLKKMLRQIAELKDAEFESLLGTHPDAYGLLKQRYSKSHMTTGEVNARMALPKDHAINFWSTAELIHQVSFGDDN